MLPPKPISIISRTHLFEFNFANAKKTGGKVEMGFNAPLSGCSRESFCFVFAWVLRGAEECVAFCTFRDWKKPISSFVGTLTPLCQINGDGGGEKRSVFFRNEGLPPPKLTEDPFCILPAIKKSGTDLLLSPSACGTKPPTPQKSVSFLTRAHFREMDACRMKVLL